MVIVGAMTDRSPSDVSAAMHADDRVAHGLDISVDAVDDGSATVSMTVTAEMCNGLGVCHGGLVFTLADTAMAHASNAANQRSVSTTAQIDWINGALVGQRLSAASSRIHQRGKLSIHDIAVTNDLGETVAFVRGQTLTVGGSVAAEATED